MLTNKYSEGYPGRRYYEGQRYVDQIESTVIERAKALFGAEHANVQPYSGSPANLAVYFALLKPGDASDGARAAPRRPSDARLERQYHRHLSGGRSVTWSIAKPSVSITTRCASWRAGSGRRLSSPALPLIRASSISRLSREIAKEVGAYLHGRHFAYRGTDRRAAPIRIPVPYADVVTTTTHKTLRGPRGAMILCRKEFADEIDKAVFPGLQGGPHNHTTAAIGVALKEAATPASRNTRIRSCATPRRWPTELIESRLRPGFGRHRQPSDPDRPDQQEA